ncbi:hypothetical protein [Cetobacterium sp.]|uniref:hypothetical protein n=1 Tax=Cetobacterium sp. TaxID=2071632 RepID=UPI003F2F4B1F
MAKKLGGARPGAGKKKVIMDPIDVNTRIEKSELELVETLGIGKTKSEKLRYVIKLGLESLLKNN